MKDEDALRPTLLLVEPTSAGRERLAGALQDGFDCLIARSCAEALKLMQENFVEVVLCATGPDAPDGPALLEEIRSHWPETVRIAVAQGPGGPALPDDLYQVVGPEHSAGSLRRMVCNAVQLFRVRRENDRMSFEMRFLARGPSPEAPSAARPSSEEGFGFETILRSAASPLNAVVSRARHLATFDVPILITGAAGTGKSQLARAIHDGSLRADRPFQSLNCAGLSPAQIRSELLGLRDNGSSRVGLMHKAERGTLFLDGIDAVPPDLQLWLARVLQDGVFHVPGMAKPQNVTFRLIAGARGNLRTLVADGHFAEELFYAFAVGLLTLPPLSERRGDIPGLAHHMLFEAARLHGKSVRGLSDEALAFLSGYDWPGNLSELRNEITRMLIFSQEPVLGPELISRHILQAAPGTEDPAAEAALDCDGTLKERVEEFERRILREALTRLKWNKSRAATELGLSRVGLRAKLDRYGLSPGVIETMEES